jgi:hypothetical protein
MKAKIEFTHSDGRIETVEFPCVQWNIHRTVTPLFNPIGRIGTQSGPTTYTLVDYTTTLTERVMDDGNMHPVWTKGEP